MTAVSRFNIFEGARLGTDNFLTHAGGRVIVGLELTWLRRLLRFYVRLGRRAVGRDGMLFSALMLRRSKIGDWHSSFVGLLMKMDRDLVGK